MPPSALVAGGDSGLRDRRWFDCVAELAPVETDTVEFARRSQSTLETDTLTPTLAWRHAAAGGSVPWAAAIDESQIAWDLEIFDQHTLVYQERDLPDATHDVTWGLEPCTAYRWSVRPIYHVDGDVRFGEWMQMAQQIEPAKSEGRIGRNAAAAPAYTQDFFELRTACER